MRAGAKVNGAELPADWKLHHVQKDEKQSSATILDLFKYSCLRISGIRIPCIKVYINGNCKNTVFNRL